MFLGSLCFLNPALPRLRKDSYIILSRGCFYSSCWELLAFSLPCVYPPLRMELKLSCGISAIVSCKERVKAPSTLLTAKFPQWRWLCQSLTVSLQRLSVVIKGKPKHRLLKNDKYRFTVWFHNDRCKLYWEMSGGAHFILRKILWSLGHCVELFRYYYLQFLGIYFDT